MSKLKHTPGPWEVIYYEQWPFRITIENYEGIEIASYDRCAHSTAQKTIEDCESAVGFKNSEKDDIIKKIEVQKANILLHACAPKMMEALIDIYKKIQNKQTILRSDFYPIIEKATGLTIEEVLNAEN